MDKLFSPDNPFMQLASRLTDLLILSILWTVCSVPLVTIGPATAALYYVAMKMVQDSESGILKAFFLSFRRNFRQGVLLTLLLCAVGVFLYWDYSIFAAQATTAALILRTVFLILGLLFLLSVGYVFPLLSQFENSVLGTLRNALLLSVAHPIRSVLILLLNAAPFAAFLLYPGSFLRWLPAWIILAPAIIAYFCSFLLYKPFTGKKIPSSKAVE